MSSPGGGLIGQTIGNYRVTRLLGEGGMGVVYEALHPVIGRKVAIKLLHVSLARDPEIVARFFNEARAIHTVGHENIVEIMDFGQTSEGQPYFVMEFLSGEAMNERLTRGALPPAMVAEVADQICRALGAAHEKGVVHRDLKPHNVQLLATTSGRIHVKLLDFGVAKIMNAGDVSQSVKTRTGSVMGTPLYMSPEQCKGAGEVDQRTDIYSLGVMLYQMLAGRPPFVAEGVGELFALHMLQAPPPLTDFAPATPPAMAAAVMNTLVKDPGGRFASMEELRRAFLADTVLAPIGASGSVGTQPYAARSGATRVAPAKAATATTFSSMTSEIEDGIAPARKGRTALVVGALLLAAAGAATYFVVLRRPAKPGDPAAANPTEEGATPGASVNANPAPASASATTVTIRFEAEPAGTHVFRATDDKDLGAAPLELRLPRYRGKPDYVFRLDGYRDQTLSADLASDQTLRAKLEKNEPPPLPVPASPPPAPTPAAGKDKEPARRPTTPQRPRKPARAPAGDQDGLATPTF